MDCFSDSHLVPQLCAKGTKPGALSLPEDADLGLKGDGGDFTSMVDVLIAMRGKIEKKKKQTLYLFSFHSQLLC